jgi:hypothetical protein
MSSTPTNLDAVRRLIALIEHESKTEATDNNSKDDERVGRLQDKNTCILTENFLGIHQQYHKVRLNAYHQSRAGEK